MSRTPLTPPSSSMPMSDLLEVMSLLRDPQNGCPWDIEQNFETIAPYTIEEAYEVADAIHRGDMDDLKDELGDLLLQVVYHTQMAQEQNLFTFNDVAAHVRDKMIHRHPHVFGEENAESAMDVEGRIWEERKAMEKNKQGLESILDDVPVGLPAIMRAQKLTKRAARVGFEWDTPEDVLEKLEEELDELRQAMANNDKENMQEEHGDLLFVVANLGRQLGFDSEESLRLANNKFEIRFKGIESEFKSNNKDLKAASLAEMEESWLRQKAKEKKNAA